MPTDVDGYMQPQDVPPEDIIQKLLESCNILWVNLQKQKKRK